MTTPEPSEVAETTAGEREVEASLLLAISDPGATTPRLPNENVTAWSARAVLASPWLAARLSAAETKARGDERERIFAALLDDDARRLMAQEYLADRNDYHGQDLTRHAQALAAGIRAVFASIARGDAR